MLKKCRAEQSKPLYLIWLKFLDTGDVPALLKISNITPIHKKEISNWAKTTVLLQCVAAEGSESAIDPVISRVPHGFVISLTIWLKKMFCS